MVDKDTMYYVQAMKAYDAANFVKAMEKEVNDLNSTGVWRWVKKLDVPENTKLICLFLEFQTKTKSPWSINKTQSKTMWTQMYATKRNQLLAYICPCCQLADSQNSASTNNTGCLLFSANQLCPRFLASTDRCWPLLLITGRILYQRRWCQRIHYIIS